MLFRLLAVFYNALPVRWQRRILDRTQSRFLVGVVGLGVDPNGHVILARHRFGAPEWRFLGGFLSPRERLQDALAREVRAFDPADLPDVRADQRGIIERRAGVAAEWARSKR